MKAIAVAMFVSVPLLMAAIPAQATETKADCDYYRQVMQQGGGGGGGYQWDAMQLQNACQGK